MKQLFIVGGTLPTLNEIINANKSGKGSKQKKEYTNLVAMSCKQQGVGQFSMPIDIKIKWHCANKKEDKDDIMAGQKFILDGLQAASIIENKWEGINRLEHSFIVDGVEYIEVELREVEE